MKRFLKSVACLIFVCLTVLIFASCNRKESIKEKDPLEITDRVLLETSEGKMVLALFGNAMPISVKNFKDYVQSGFYDGLIFHRVVKNFVIQGGGFDENLVQKETKPPIKLEIPPIEEVKDKNGKIEKRVALTHDKYVLAMARTRDPDSASSQFYITLAPAKNLDPLPDPNARNGYAVFGKVEEGFEVVDKIGAKEVGVDRGFRDVPLEPVKIFRASLIVPPTAGEKK